MGHVTWKDPKLILAWHRLPAHPSFGMKTTQAIGNLFVWYSPKDTHHGVNRLQSFGQAIDDKWELVFADMNQAFLVLFNILYGLGGMQSGPYRQLKYNIIFYNALLNQSTFEFE